MSLADYFQAPPKCPVCKKDYCRPDITVTQVFKLLASSQPVPAGQCHECKADLQFVRSWKKALTMGAFGGVSSIVCFAYIVLESKLMIGASIGTAIFMGFVCNKELRATQKNRPLDK